MPQTRPSPPCPTSPPPTRRPPGGVWRRVGTAVLGLCLAAPVAAQPVDPDRAVLPGLIVEESAARRDAQIPGARARRPLAAAAAARRATLAETRSAVDAYAGGAAFDAIAPLPGEAGAPPPFDGGDPDPDRLRHSPPPPAP